MQTSQQIDQIAAALAAAQGEMTGAKKSSANPYFKSSYADLASVMEAIAAPFAAHGLSFIQSAGQAAHGGGVSVTTLLMHSSGQWIESDPMVLPPVKNDPQAFGSAVTYAKRYSLQAMVGVPSVDDDAAAATAAPKAPARPKKAPAIDLTEATAKLKAGAEDGLNGLSAAWKALSGEERNALGTLKDQLKAKLQEAA